MVSRGTHRPCKKEDISVDIGIKYKKGIKYSDVLILPETLPRAEEERLCGQYALFHFKRRLPLYGNGKKQYFVLTSDLHYKKDMERGCSLDRTAFFINADDIRSAKSIAKEVLTNTEKGTWIRSLQIGNVKGSKYAAEVSPIPKDTMEEIADIEAGIKDALVKIREVARRYGCDICISATDNYGDVDMNVSIEHRGKAYSFDEDRWRTWNLRRAEIQSILENSLYKDKREERELVREAEALDALIEKWDGVYEW